MANYEDENTQFSTILSIDDSGVWLENDLWGKFFTKRFDGSISWNSEWRKNLKPGDVIPVLRQKRGKTCVYMTGFELHTTREKLMDYINMPKQEAVVTSVVQVQRDLKTQVSAYSPVWKTIYYESSYGMMDVQRGDIVVFSRKKKGDFDYEYRLVENKTQEEIKNKGIAKILNDFTEADRTRLLILSDEIRMGLVK